jgi:beta-lactamase regulating signal transducer with metallopeptidase domain
MFSIQPTPAPPTEITTTRNDATTATSSIVSSSPSTTGSTSSITSSPPTTTTSMSTTTTIDVLSNNDNNIDPETSTSPDEFPLALVLGIALGVVCCILIVGAAAVLFTRRSRDNDSNDVPVTVQDTSMHSFNSNAPASDYGTQSASENQYANISAFGLQGVIMCVRC